jgi:pimeloyl-ACP methyl ester carboxylesterase
MGLGAEELDVAVPDGSMRVLRWGTGSHAVVAVHGITASAACWQAVACALPAGWSLFAPDLRGRGHSAGLPGPYGFSRHTADLLAVVDDLGLDRPVLAGHSLGAYASLLTVAAEPAAFRALVLVDGGLPLPVPAGADLDEVLDASLGPALARLRKTFPSVAAYYAYWQAHPAFAGVWNSYIEDYLRYDLTGPAGTLRSRVAEEAARSDGRELLSGEAAFGAALRGLAVGTRLLTAPAGMFGRPPGMIPPSLTEAWLAQAPRLSAETVPGTNHYTIILDPAPAALVASRIAGAAVPPGGEPG